jgi:colanic acid/amylovoran biosynthesis glycosyltransferase
MTAERIAYVVQCFPKLTQTFVAGELAEVRRRGIEIVVVSLRRPTEAMRHDIVAKAGLDRLTVYDPEEFIPRLIEFQPQLLHAHFATDATTAARVLAAEIGVPFTFTAHGYDIYFRPPADFHERAAAAAAVMTVSEANRRHISNALGVPADHIRVIPNGIDTDFFCPAPQPEGRAGQTPLIVCVARHEPVKNLPILLEACAILRNRRIEFRCAIIGDGADRIDLEAMRHRLELDSLVEMTGAMVRTEVLKWWRRASVAVLSSDSEGMPVSLIEAAACGVPVVATRVGGIPELVEHGVTGLLVPPRDASALADGLAKMLLEPHRAAAMGRAARGRVEEKFSLGLQVDRLIATWEGLLERFTPRTNGRRLDD